MEISKTGQNQIEIFIIIHFFVNNKEKTISLQSQTKGYGCLF